MKLSVLLIAILGTAQLLAAAAISVAGSDPIGNCHQNDLALNTSSGQWFYCNAAWIALPAVTVPPAPILGADGALLYVQGGKAVATTDLSVVNHTLAFNYFTGIGAGINSLKSPLCLDILSQVSPFCSLGLGAGEVVLGYRQNADFNSTMDQSIPIIGNGYSTRYRITRILVTHASGPIQFASGGIYDWTNKTNTVNQWVSAAQVYRLGSSWDFQELILDPALTTRTVNRSGVFLSLTVPEGSSVSADVYVMGAMLP